MTQRWALGRPSVRTVLVAGLVVVLVAGLLVVGTSLWKRAHRSDLQQALDAVPASSLRIGFTDWAAVRRTLHARLGEHPSASKIEAFTSKAYDGDFSAVSSIDDSAVALDQKYGFGPATAQWEAYAQSKKGATMVLKVPHGTDFDTLADNLRSAGYTKPKDDDGVWKGGVDLVASLDPTLSPELQYVALLKGPGLVVTSDTASYARSAARVASGDADAVSSRAGVDDVARQLGHPTDAMVWAGDFACKDLAMSQAAKDDQAQADQLVAQAGEITPLAGLGMAMAPDRTLRVVATFEDDERAQKNLRSRARLAVGDAVGRGGTFSDDFKLTSSKALDKDVVLTLQPRTSTGFVLSALYDGPVLFATC